MAGHNAVYFERDVYRYSTPQRRTNRKRLPIGSRPAVVVVRVFPVRASDAHVFGMMQGLALVNALPYDKWAYDAVNHKSYSPKRDEQEEHSNDTTETFTFGFYLFKSPYDYFAC